SSGDIKIESGRDDFNNNDDRAMTSLNDIKKNHGSCTFCRERHLYCRGTPTCYNCELRSIPCVFPSPKKRGPKPKSASDNSNCSTFFHYTSPSIEVSTTPNYALGTSSSPFPSNEQLDTGGGSSAEFRLVEPQDSYTKNH